MEYLYGHQKDSKGKPSDRGGLHFPPAVYTEQFPAHAISPVNVRFVIYLHCTASYCRCCRIGGIAASTFQYGALHKKTAHIPANGF